jgi:glycosyltransferase involved in cell wall biosynthesis
VDVHKIHQVTPPTLTVVVPAYNEEKYVRACIESLAEQIDEIEEIIAVDNGSSDETAAILQELGQRIPKLQVHTEAVPGLIATRNKGFGLATADIVARVDADAVVHEGWASAVREFFENAPPEFSVVTGPFGQYDMPFQGIHHRILRSVYAPYDHDPDSPYFEFNHAIGSNMAIRRNSWDKIREHLTVGYNLREDYDFSCSTARAGYKIAVVRKMKVSVSGRRMLTSPVAYWKFTQQTTRTIKMHHGVGKKYFAAMVGTTIMRAFHLVMLVPGRSYDPATGKFTVREIFQGGHARVSATDASRLEG